MVLIEGNQYVTTCEQAQSKMLLPVLTCPGTKFGGIEK